MAVYLTYSDAAIDGLARMRRWYNQSGAGPRAKEKARKIAAEIRGLRTTAGTHAIDRFNPKNRQLLVEDYTVSYYVTQSAAGDTYISVDQVYGPGQDRTVKEMAAATV